MMQSRTRSANRIDILDIEIEAERIVLRAHRPARQVVEVQMPATSVFQDAVMTEVCSDRKAEPFVKGGAGIEIVGGDDGDAVVIHGDAFLAAYRAC